MPIASHVNGAAEQLRTIAFLPAPPPYDPTPSPDPAQFRENPLLDREDGGSYVAILEAALRHDVWRLRELAAGRLSFREERLLIDSAFDRICDDYDRYQILDGLAGNSQLTQLGRDHLWNSLNRLGNVTFRRRVADALRWNYPC